MAPKGRFEFIRAKPASVQLLEKQLTSSDPEVRKVGVDSIPRIQAPVEPLTDCTAAQLEHQNWFVRRSAAGATAISIQSRDAADPSVRQVAGPRLVHKDAEVRRCAAQALVGVVEIANAPDAPASIPPLVADTAAKEVAMRLKEDDPRIRQNAVEALGRMGEAARAHMKAMAALLADEDISVRNAVVKACTTLGVVAAEAAEQVADHLSHEDDAVRRSANLAVIALSEHSGEETAKVVAKQLEWSNVVVKRWILLTMVELGPLSAPHGKILASMLEDEDGGIRATAIRALVAASPGVAQSSLKWVFRRMEHTNRDVRRAAVDAMRALAPLCPTYAQAIGKSLHEEDGPKQGENINRQRIDVLTILGGAGSNAEPYLEEIATELEDKDWGVRRAAVEALEDLGEVAAPAARYVARRLLHHEPDVRRSAAEALGRMGVHCGAYAQRVEELAETEEDEDVKLTCERAVDMLNQAGAFATSEPPSPWSPMSR